MKEIFLGEVYEVLPLNNGIIFSYCKDVIDENVVVAYKMISFENGNITDIAKNIYLLTKFGNNYKAIVSVCDNYITVKSILLAGGKVFLLSTDGTAKLVGTDGEVIWRGDLIYRTHKPSDLILYNNAFWVSYPECNSVLRYNISTMREELRIGGIKSPFDKPKDLFLEGDVVTISNYGSKKLIEMDLKTYSVKDRESFEEPIYQYVKVGNMRFVVLESGLYLI
ncbi:MAG: hypothetical protein E7560_02020 [Ruminococcaceae bacterium]|nr:hypothetical protein [Oscillospiraceae bacterium]